MSPELAKRDAIGQAGPGSLPYCRRCSYAAAVTWDCCECGACCFSDSDAYVPVTADDIKLMGKRAIDLCHEVDGEFFLRMTNGHCAQLEHAEGEWVCGAYSLRPQACRDLKAGSADCLAERGLKRIRASRASKKLLG